MIVTKRLGLLAALLALVGGDATGLRAAPAPERLMPDSATEFLASPNLKQARQGFFRTGYGKAINDPLLEPFINDLLEQMKKNGSQDYLGFNFKELPDIGNGGAWATVPLGPRQPGYVLILDVTGKAKEREAALAERARRWTGLGGTQRIQKVGGEDVTIQELAASGTGKAQLRAHLVKDNVLVAADDLAVLEGVLARWGGAGNNSLADLPGFRQVMDQTTGKDKAAPQLRFYFNVFPYLELSRPAPKGPKKRDTLERLKKLGFDGIKAFGGFVTFDHPDYELYYRTAVYAPGDAANGQFQKGMKVLKLPTGSDFLAEEWVPAKVSVYTTFNFDLLNAFDSFDPIFDLVAADGEQGTFKEVIADLKNEPNGPRVDVRKEVLAELANRVTVVTDTVQPITQRSARLLLAIATRKEKVVEDAVRRLLKDEEGVRQRIVQGFRIWELPARTRRSRSGGKAEAVRMPGYSVCVARGYLFISTHIDLMESIIRKDDSAARLRQNADYLRVRKEMERLGGGRAVGQQFSYTAEDFRTSFELTRMNKLEGAESLYSRLILAATRANGNDGIKPNGALLPEYDKVKHHLGVAGNFTRNWAHGWETVGFYLKKASP